MRQHWWESIRKKHTCAAWVLQQPLPELAEVALSYYFYVYPSVGSVFINFGFVACCIGGMGSIPGAVIGGVLMGIMDTVVGTYTNAALKYLAVFALFLFVVYKRPKGLFGW